MDTITIDRPLTHGKECRRCGETLPLSRFNRNGDGTPRPDCYTCAYAKRKANREARPEWKQAFERREREREARRISKEYRQARREAAKDARETASAAMEAERAAKEARQVALRATEEVRRRRREERKRGIRKRPLSPERRNEIANEVSELAALLMGTHSLQRISDQQTWEATANKLQRLWHLSGDKECVSCKETVPPTAMRPPGPANFYPGTCNACATAECQASQLKVFGKITTEAPKIHLRDGTSITIANFARRVREREQPYRSNR